MAAFCLTQRQGFESVKKTITLLCGAAFGIILANNAIARTCDNIYIVHCPIKPGEPTCCRSSSETCAEAGCISTIIDPAECPSACPKTTWTSILNMHYQIRCRKTATNALCEYRCFTGYYGKGTSCTRCPASDGVYGTTAAAGASVITECYQPADIEMGDQSGTYQYINDCYYSD